MNKYILVICVAILLACQQEQAQQKTLSSEDVKENLKAIVEGETFAYMKKDYKKWASYWDKSSDVLRLDVSPTGFVQRGWEESSKNLEVFFMDHPEPITSTFENTNYLIFHDGNLAWVAFDQTWTTESGEKSVAKATITLIKKAGDWKMVSYTAIQYETEDENVDTLERE